MRDAIDERARFSCTGARDDQERALAVGRGRGLLGVQFSGEIAAGRAERLSFAWDIESRAGGVHT